MRAVTLLGSTRRRAALSGIAALLSFALPVSAGAAPTAEEIRACVEGNLARYAPPDTAVAAQYSDAEAICAAALADGAVQVDFAPSGTPAGTDPAGDSSAPSGGVGSGRQSSPGDESPQDDPSTTGGGSLAPSKPSATVPSSGQVVANAIAAPDAGAGSPLPSAIGGPWWMIALLAGALAIIGGAAVVALRRRPS